MESIDQIEIMRITVDRDTNELSVWVLGNDGVLYKAAWGNDLTPTDLQDCVDLARFHHRQQKPGTSFFG